MDYRVHIIRGWLLLLGLALFVAFGPGEWTLFVYSLVPVGMMFCPVDVATVCGSCLEGTRPASASVTVAGMVNGTCTDCDNFNITYSFTFSTPSACTASLSLPSVCGGAAGGQALFSYGVSLSPLFDIGPYGSSPSDQHRWANQVSGPVDCGAFTGDMPLILDSGGRCSAANATAVLNFP